MLMRDSAVGIREYHKRLVFFLHRHNNAAPNYLPPKLFTFNYRIGDPFAGCYRTGDDLLLASVGDLRRPNNTVKAASHTINTAIKRPYFDRSICYGIFLVLPINPVWPKYVTIPSPGEKMVWFVVVKMSSSSRRNPIS